MDDREKKKLQEAMYEEQEDALLRDEIKELEREFIKSAKMFKARYDSYLKVGLREDQAFMICLNREMVILQMTLGRNDGRI